MPRRHPDRRAMIELCEPRRHLAAYGNPWPEGSRLTFSFAPDDTPLVGLTSQLFASLDAAQPRAQWQEQVARALQTWAVHTDLNLGFRPDAGDRFGTPGFTLGDPRFGDVRIGAHDMGDGVLAVSIPYDPARAGTLTGDIFFNTAYRFDNSPYDLFTVMLHEAGHVFGLNHSPDPASPMFERFINPVASLTPGDIAAIRALYGPRAPDRFDALGPNNTPGDARPIDIPNGFDGTTPLAVFGDLTGTDDADYFKFQTPSDDDGYTGTVRVILQSSGISLVRPSLEVLDRKGVPVGASISSSWLGDRLEVAFHVDSDDTDFTLRIDSPADDVFAVGRYVAFVVFDERNIASADAIDFVAIGPHEALDADTLRQLFLDASGVYLLPDFGSDDSPADARSIELDAGRLELLGSIESPGDVDHFQLLAAPPGILTLHVWSNDPRGLAPTLDVVNHLGQSLPAVVIANGNGMATLQIHASAAQPLIVRVGGSDTGNYFLTLDRSTPGSSLQTFAGGSVSTSVRVDTLFVAESQLMHLLLTVAPHAQPSAGLTLELVRADSGAVVHRLAASQGQSVSGASILLTPGAYRVQYQSNGLPSPALRRQLLQATPSASLAAVRVGQLPRPTLAARLDRMAEIERDGLAFPLIQFTLQGSTLSGPIGPAPRDPLLRPRYRHPTLPNAQLFPNGVVTSERLLWVIGLAV